MIRSDNEASYRGFLADLREADLAVVLAYTQATLYAPGEFAVHEGEVDRSFFIISRGSFEVVVPTEGRTRRVRILEPGPLRRGRVLRRSPGARRAWSRSMRPRRSCSRRPPSSDCDSRTRGSRSASCSTSAGSSESASARPTRSPATRTARGRYPFDCLVGTLAPRYCKRRLSQLSTFVANRHGFLAATDEHPGC